MQPKIRIENVVNWRLVKLSVRTMCILFTLTAVLFFFGLDPEDNIMYARENDIIIAIDTTRDIQRAVIVMTAAALLMGAAVIATWKK